MVFRIIARLDVKPPDLVKGIHLEGVRKLGKPEDFAETYFEQGVDELFYQDVVASLYGRNGIEELVKRTAQKIFVPLTVGGGIRSTDDIQTMLRNGADKISVNTMAIRSPELIAKAARLFGVQCITVALEVAPSGPGKWEPLIDSGREHTSLDAEAWAREAVAQGAGELLITSIEKEGTRKGFDFSFADKLLGKVKVPVILHGGCGSAADVVEAAKRGYSGVAISSALHYRLTTVDEIRNALLQANVEVRT